jgi:energy-coupling factor transporter transmembrane protein EcfT
MELDPRTRLAVFLALSSGVLICRSELLLVLLLTVGALLAAYRGRLSNVLSSVLRPTVLTVPMLFLTWGALAPMPSHADGMRFAALTSLRLVALLFIMSSLFGELTAAALARQLRSWRIRKDAITAVLGIVTLWPEIRRRTTEIIEARYARGLIRRRSVLDAAFSLPSILRPLVAWSLRSAISRAESWERRSLSLPFDEHPTDAEPRDAGLILLGAAMFWVFGALWSRFS